ncbi:MAG: T9SS type A sorting domain-containing protein [Bacteroidales bacterium]|nr:T9SS type A sorting domain-containing protein [Bacteroidales bacterium]
MSLRRVVLLFLALLASLSAISQGLSCADSDPFCTGTIYEFPAGTTGAAEAGPYYGCLSTQPAPAWYHMKIGNPGPITIYMHSEPQEDIDFACWGPYTDPTSACPYGLTQSKMVDCSYSTSWQEYCDIPNGQTGQYYILLITNYSQDPCNIIFSQTAGSGTTDCSILPPLVWNDSPLCVGETLHLSAETISNATYSWTGPAGFSSTQQNPEIPNVTLAMAGDYSCIITVFSQSSPPAITSVVINDLPDAFLLNTSQTTCPGDTVMIALQLTGAAPFTLTCFNGTIYTTYEDLYGPVDTIYLAPPGPVTYTFTQVDDTNCTKYLAGVVFTVYNFPPATGVLSGGETICSGDTSELVFNLTGTPPWEITYLTNGMNPVTVVAEYTPFSVFVTPQVTTVYQFTQLSDLHCEGSASGQVQVSVDYPTGTLSGDNTICAGSGAILLFILSGYPPWTITYTENGGNGQEVTTYSSPYALTVYPVENTLYEFTLLSDNYCTGSASGQAMITINQPTGVLSGESTICAGESSEITFDLGGVAPWHIIFEQNGGDPQELTAYATPFHVAVSPMVTSLYTFTYFEDGACEGIPSGSAQVMVNPLPVAEAGNDKTIPNGTSTTLNGSVSGGSGSYAVQWEPASKLVNPDILQPQTVNLFESTLFTLTITDDEGGCMGQDEALVTITGGTLSCFSLSAPSVICRGQSSQLQVIASGGSGTYTYLWQSDPPGFSSDLAVLQVNPVVTTTYTVTVNDGFNVSQSQVTVQVDPLPVPFAGDNQVIVYGTPTQLHGTASQGSGNYSFHWEPAYKLIDPDSENPHTVNLYETTVFTLSVTDLETGCPCEAVDAVSVMINGSALSVNPTALPNEICLGDTVQLFSSSGGGTGIYSHTWTSLPEGFNSSEADPLVVPGNSMTYLVDVWDGYNWASGSVEVKVNPNPVVHMGNDTTVCVFDTITLDAGPDGASYLWFNGATGRYISISSTGIGYEARQVSVEVASDKGCMTRSSKTINFDFTACSGVEDPEGHPSFRIFPNPGNGVITFEFSKLSGPASLIIFDSFGRKILYDEFRCTSQENYKKVFDISFNSRGLYLIRLMISDNVYLFKYVLNRPG